MPCLSRRAAGCTEQRALLRGREAKISIAEHLEVQLVPTSKCGRSKEGKSMLG